MKIEGYIEPDNFIPRAGIPKPGQRLFLATEDNDVVTSPVVAIVCLPRTTVVEYPTADELALSAWKPAREAILWYRAPGPGEPGAAFHRPRSFLSREWKDEKTGASRR